MQILQKPHEICRVSAISWYARAPKRISTQYSGSIFLPVRGIFAPKFADNNTANLQKGDVDMTRKQNCYIRSAAAGVITGALAFFAVRSLCPRRSFRRMSAAKAFRMIGTLMDAF